MEVSIRAINLRKLVLKLVEAGSITKKVATMMASGNKITCMVMANFFMQIPSQLMKGNGIMIGFMEKGRFIMTNLLFFTLHLIIQTLTI